MTVYKKENPDYLFESIKSIWDDQTLKPTEIVIVKDGELSDELDLIISRWQVRLGSVLKVIMLRENHGLTRALNLGIDFCSGDFVARMDSDDISAPDRFSKQYDLLLHRPEVMLVGGSIKEFSDTNPCLCVRTYPLSSREIRNYMHLASPFAHASVMFRRVVFESGLRYAEEYRTSQDIDLWYRMVNMGYEVANLNDVIYYVRITPNFFKRRSRNKALDEFKIYWRGIKSIHGYSWKMIFPIVRLVFRLSPNFIIRKSYYGKARHFLNSH